MQELFSWSQSDFLPAKTSSFQNSQQIQFNPPVSLHLPPEPYRWISKPWPGWAVPLLCSHGVLSLPPVPCPVPTTTTTTAFRSSPRRSLPGASVPPAPLQTVPMSPYIKVQFLCPLTTRPPWPCSSLSQCLFHHLKDPRKFPLSFGVP